MDWAPRLVRTKDGRRVGYRRAGSGPPVAMLHASPRSSAALVPLGEALADRFTVFAFDNPGFGWSDPLAIPRPDAADFGAALIGAFDALGIGSARVYGSHTGGAIAVAAAISHPARIPALVLDGYAIFTPAEQAEAMANYLMPFRPSWDGSHLAALWSRVKDQFTFFPWYLRADAGRIPRELVPLALLQDVIVDFLAAGDNYRPAYAAAFRYAGAEALHGLTVPTTIVARTDDLLFGHLDRLTDVPAHVSLCPLGPDRAAWAAVIREKFEAAAAGEAPPLPGDASESVLRVPGGTLGINRIGNGAGKPIVVLPAIPGSVAGSAGLMRALAAARPVIGIDLPGFGTSSLQRIDLAGVVQALHAALGQLGLQDADIVACEESAAIGCGLAQRWPGGRVVLLNPVADSSRAALTGGMADVTPRIDGAHLLAAWHQLRDRSLWRPWFQRDPAHALPAGTDPDVPRLHAIMTDWMRGGAQGSVLLQAGFSQPLAAALSGLSRVSVLTRAGHPWETELRRLAAHIVTASSGDDRGCAGMILDLLGA